VSLVGSILRFILLATIISLCLLSCSAVSSKNKAPLSVAELSYYFLDDAFEVSHSAIDAPEFFLELPEAYKYELDKIMAPLEIEFDRYSALRAWAFGQIEDYQFAIAETYSLGELNTNRRINCLSFSVMFVAAARHVNMPAEFQLVYAPPYWDIDNKTWINNQHIDVTGVIKRKSSATDPFLESGHSLASGLPYINPTFVRSNSFRYVVDLNPAIVSMPLKRERLDDRQILSLYFNNKGMASLLAGDRGMAYAYTKKALLTDSGSAPAWNNLGVLFSRLGELDYAENAFLKAIEMDGDASSARSNIAHTYRRQGKYEQAIEMELLVARFRNDNPYYHQFLAAQSLNDSNYEQAIEHLENAVARKHNELAFYHELALAHQKLGHDEKVMQNLRKARRHAKGIQKQRFSGKLEALQALVESP
jgi:tetratricopeptide (TPR) repeat protein